jgi:hypothetical protein
MKSGSGGISQLYMEVNGPRHMPVPYLLGVNTKNL